MLRHDSASSELDRQGVLGSAAEAGQARRRDAVAARRGGGNCANSHCGAEEAGIARRRRRDGWQRGGADTEKRWGGEEGDDACACLEKGFEPRLQIHFVAWPGLPIRLWALLV
jgi:hypothetical protein